MPFMEYIGDGDNHRKALILALVPKEPLYPKRRFYLIRPWGNAIYTLFSEQYQKKGTRKFHHLLAYLRLARENLGATRTARSADPE